VSTGNICGLGHANVAGASFCSICGQALSGGRAEVQTVTGSLDTPLPSPRRKPSRRSAALIGLGIVVMIALVASFPVRSALNSTTVPNVSGMSSKDAEAAAASASLGDVVVTSDYSDTIADGLVMSQEPSAGEGATKGSPLAIVVSQGPRLVTMTVTEDVSDGLLDLDLDLECSTYIILFSATYDDSVVVDENDVRLSSMTSAGWTEDPSNGTYFPCNARATFEGVPENRAKYRVNLSIDEPENNNLGWVTGDEARAQDFQLVD
jgi:PASTA domain